MKVDEHELKFRKNSCMLRGKLTSLQACIEGALDTVIYGKPLRIFPNVRNGEWLHSANYIARMLTEYSERWRSIIVSDCCCNTDNLKINKKKICILYPSIDWNFRMAYEKNSGDSHKISPNNLTKPKPFDKGECYIIATSSFYQNMFQFLRNVCNFPNIRKRKKSREKFLKFFTLRFLS